MQNAVHATRPKKPFVAHNYKHRFLRLTDDGKMLANPPPLHRYDLADDTSNRLAPLLPVTVGDRGRTARDIQHFLDATHFMTHPFGPKEDTFTLPLAA